MRVVIIVAEFKHGKNHLRADVHGYRRTTESQRLYFLSQLGVDIEAARKEEERVMLRDARQWLNSGQIQDVRHAKSGGTALHVAAAKGYVEVLK